MQQYPIEAIMGLTSPRAAVMFIYLLLLLWTVTRKETTNPLKVMKRPPKSTTKFKTKPPSLSELNAYLQKRRNAPGTNRILYLVWKKCPRITGLLYKVICNIWRSASIPTDWEVGKKIFISTEENTSDPAFFRPITLKNSGGNLGMGILAQRTKNSWRRMNILTNLSKRNS